jgi:DNA polymerase-3 subunit delta'
VGKKEIGVEVAREIKGFVHLRSTGGGTGRIVVIDDADRLSIAAQNALLKTLEEPPGHAILILVTGSPGGLLPTVRSRCQRITLRPLAEADLRAVLRQQNLDDVTIDQLLPLAQGSAGRALKLRGIIEGADVDRLQRALASLRSGRYGPVVEFTQALGGNEQEMSTRLDVLTEVLQHSLTESVRTGNVDAVATDERLRVIELFSEFRRLLRRGNPNRTLLAEAAAIRCERILTDASRVD